MKSLIMEMVNFRELVVTHLKLKFGKWYILDNDKQNYNLSSKYNK